VSLSQFQSAHASLMHFSKAAALSAVEVPLSSFFFVSADRFLVSFESRRRAEMRSPRDRLDAFFFNIHHGIDKL
jgi:hypothetical protein